MREFQEKHQFRRRMYSITTLIVLFIVIILLIRCVMGVYTKEKASQDDLAITQKQQAELAQRHDALQADSDRLKTEAGIEAEIRSKFDVTKQGEGVIVVVDKSTPQVEQDNRSMIKKIWDSVMGVFGKGVSTSTVH